MKSLRAVINSPFAAALPALAALMAWIVFTESGFYLRDPSLTTQELIKSTDKLVQNHVRAWGEAPSSMNELRLFAKQTYSSCSAFDVWGQRLEYLRLGKMNYTIRSFGADGLQNRPGQPLDPGVFRWGQMEKRGLRYNDEVGLNQARPSVALFAGADDSSGQWHGKLFVDPMSGTRRLLVRDRRESRFYMLAAHDSVEEFLWIPGQQKIIFTASESARYADGVYLWDLASDEVTHLLDIGNDESDMNPARRERSLYLALSSVRAGNPPSAAVFVVPAQQNMLNPQDFFQPANLHVFELGSAIKHVFPAANAAPSAAMNTMDFLGTLTVVNEGGGNPQQLAWLRLPMGGDWEKAILKWQEFAAAHGKTQLAPYAVWGLSVFYREASRQAGLDTKSGKIFAGYSVELAQALSQMPTAPGYARAIGAWMGANP